MLLSLVMACLPPILDDTAGVDDSGIGDDTGAPSDPADSSDTSETGTPIADADADGYESPDDCNDDDAAVHPGATELLNWADEDCDGESVAFASNYAGSQASTSVGYTWALKAFPPTDASHRVAGAFRELAGGAVIVATRDDIADGTIQSARSVIGDVSDEFGYDLQVVDVDGDAKEDLLIGDPGRTGAYWIVDSALLPGVGAIDVATLPTFGDSTGVGRVGAAAEVIGDQVAVTGFGAADSAVYLLDAATLAKGSATEVTAGTRISSAGGVALFGAALGHLDADGDGLAELLVGAPSVGGSGGTAAGAIFVFNGLDLAGTNELTAGDADVTLSGTAKDEQLGGGFLPAGDLDGDGAEDVLVTTYAHDADRTFYMLRGDSPWTQGLITATSHTKITGLTTYDDGAAIPTSYLSATTVDVDGDGAKELFAGSPGPGNGNVYVFSGEQLGISASYTGADASVDLVGPTADDGFGKDVAAAGDGVDTEGLLLVAAPGADDGTLWTVPFAF